MNKPVFHRRRGLTLVELLIAVGIIALLLSMLIVVIPKMRAASKRATAQQQLNTLQSAIDAYFTDFRAYPGPLAEANLYANTNAPANVTGTPTMSENVTIGILGVLTDLAFRGVAHVALPWQRMRRG